jgi:hypothetical protein
MINESDEASKTVKSLTDEYSVKISESLNDAKNFIQSDIIEVGKSKFGEVIDSTKEFFNFSGANSKSINEINNLSNIQPDITNEKIDGMNRSMFIKLKESELEEGAITITKGSETPPVIQSISSSTTVIDAPKPTPRNNNQGSALERYINKISYF